MNNDFNYKIIKNIGVISTSPSGWNKEVNLISWNDREPVIDIRSFNPDHTKMGKGITIADEEVKTLISLLNKYMKNNPQFNPF